MASLVVGLAALPAHAALDVSWDCFLAAGQVACLDLERAVFSDASFVHAAGAVAETTAGMPGAADVNVTVRAMGVSDGTVYEVGVLARSGLQFIFKDAVPRGFSGDAVLMRLVGDIQKATVPLFVLDEPAHTHDGQLHLALRDPDAGPRDARTDDETTGWYVGPELSFQAERYGVTSLHARGNLEVNWSSPAWRLHGWGWSNFRLVQAEPVDGTEDPDDLHYENFDVGTDWTLARSLAGGFSLAAQVNIMREPQQNYLLRADTYVGAEWVLVPFLKTDEGNFGIQYVIGAEHQDYVYKTVLQKKTYNFMRHRASVFGTWHWNRVDVDVRLNGSSKLDDLRFSSIGAGGGLTWRVLDDLSFSVNGDASYRSGLVQEPADRSQLHPLEQFYGGGAYGDVTLWTYASMQYVFGNSLIKNQDQRWR